MHGEVQGWRGVCVSELEVRWGPIGGMCVECTREGLEGYSVGLSYHNCPPQKRAPSDCPRQNNWSPLGPSMAL